MEAVPKHLLGRLLFCNPACVLITENVANVEHNDIAAGENLGDDHFAVGDELNDHRAATSPAPIVSQRFNAMTVTWLTPGDKSGKTEKPEPK